MTVMMINMMMMMTMVLMVSTVGSLSNDNGDRRQSERHKIAYLMSKNKFARRERAFSTFVHFFAVVSKTTT